MKTVHFISDEYLQIQKEHHEQSPGWGTHGDENAPLVAALAAILDTQDVLDYGCGKGAFAKAMPFPVKEYDPAIPGKDTGPERADIIHCNQILQHVETSMLPYILDRLNDLSRKACLMWLKYVPGATHWRDGRNSTMTLWPPDKWTVEIAKHFPERLVLVKGLDAADGYLFVMTMAKEVFDKLIFR